LASERIKSTQILAEIEEKFLRRKSSAEVHVKMRKNSV
jgi:hypothetical protein